MKTRLLKVSFLFILFITVTEAYASKKPVVVKIGGYEYSPFIEKEGKEGIVKDLIDNLNATQKKYHFEFVLTSANRRYRDFVGQRYDVILFEDESWSWKDVGVKYDRTPVLGLGGEMAVAYNDGSRDQSYFENMQDKKVEVVLGFHYQVTDMKTDAESVTQKGIIQGKSYEDNLADLIAKKVDVTFVNSFALNKFLNKNKDLKDKLLIRQKLDHQFALRGLVHPNSPIKVSELEKLGLNKILVSDD